MMEKYGEREAVTEQDLRNCIDDVEALKQAGKLYKMCIRDRLALDTVNQRDSFEFCE